MLASRPQAALWPPLRERCEGLPAPGVRRRFGAPTRPRESPAAVGHSTHERPMHPPRGRAASPTSKRGGERPKRKSGEHGPRPNRLESQQNFGRRCPFRGFNALTHLRERRLQKHAGPQFQAQGEGFEEAVTETAARKGQAPSSAKAGAPRGHGTARRARLRRSVRFRFLYFSGHEVPDRHPDA